ncbi:MAG: site-2 protease family protein [Malacoplasma sp.]
MELFLIIFFILLFIFVSITIHELGHFFAAKLLHVRVKEISIGIGPKIFIFKSKNTWVSLRLFPIIAYVLIDSRKLIDTYNEAITEVNFSFEKKISNIKNTDSLYYKFLLWSNSRKITNYKYFSNSGNPKFLIDNKYWWEKNLIFAGGIFFNAIIFLVFFFVQYYFFGYYGSPYNQVGQSFLIMFKNMVFLDTTGYTLFGSFIELNNTGEIQHVNIPLVIVNYLVVFNLMIFIYNIIPFPPLDGYKMLSILIEKFFNVKINKKFETCLTIIGIVILFYIFITTVIANIRFS